MRLTTVTHSDGRVVNVIEAPRQTSGAFQPDIHLSCQDCALFKEPPEYCHNYFPRCSAGYAATNLKESICFLPDTPENRVRAVVAWMRPAA